MILLNQDTTNKIALTLNEKCSLTGTTPYYLFSFIDVNSRIEKLFTSSDISTCKARYNQFNISLTGGTENLTGGTITLPSSTYDYTIYSMTGQTNLLVSATTEIVEVGIAKIVGTASTKTQYSNKKTNTIFYNS